MKQDLVNRKHELRNYLSSFEAEESDIDFNSMMKEVKDSALGGVLCYFQKFAL